jgi:uncharacterized protein YlzI (FlbEa/FlbD family)
MIIELTRHDGQNLFLAVEHIAAWGLFPGGSAPTEIILSSGKAFYVQETPEEIYWRINMKGG